MPETTTVTVTAGGMPAAELERLLTPLTEEEGVELDLGPADTRSVDPTIVVAGLQMVATLAAPILQKLAERLFQRAPRATLQGTAADGSSVELSAADAPAERAQKITLVIENPRPELTIVLS
jgi:hypothetical protein